MNAKEFHDELIARALDGRFPAVDEKGNCMLRVGNKKCAAGICIPDEAYDPEMENMSIGVALGMLQGAPDYRRGQRMLAAIVVPEGMTMADLQKCQGYHDDWPATAKDPEVPRRKFIEYINALPCFQGM